MSGTIVARTRAGIPIYGTMPLDPLIHSLAWVRKEAKDAKFMAECVEIYRNTTARHCPSCSCQKTQKGKPE